MSLRVLPSIFFLPLISFTSLGLWVPMALSLCHYFLPDRAVRDRGRDPVPPAAETKPIGVRAD